MEPTIITIDNKNYYNAEDLKEFDISYFAKTNKTIRNIIKNKNIPENQYKYFCFNKKENMWKESDKEKPSPKAKLFIKEKWSKENIPKFNEEIKNEYEEAPTPSGTYFVRQALLASKLCLRQFIYKLTLSF